MTPRSQATPVLKRACSSLVVRLEALEERLENGDDALWETYLVTVQTLSALLPHLTPSSDGRPLATKEMADRLGISSKTLLKKKLQPALRRGQRGRAAIRWKGTERLVRLGCEPPRI